MRHDNPDFLVPGSGVLRKILWCFVSSQCEERKQVNMVPQNTKPNQKKEPKKRNTETINGLLGMAGRRGARGYGEVKCACQET